MEAARREAIEKAIAQSHDWRDPNAFYFKLREADQFEAVLHDNGFMIVPTVIVGAAGFTPAELRAYQLGYMARADRQLHPDVELVGKPGDGWSE